MKKNLRKISGFILCLGLSSQISFSQNFGNSLWFDGANDHVLVGNSNNLLEPANFTFEAWFKKDRINSPSGKDRIMISVGSSGWGVGINPTNKIFFTKTGVTEKNTNAVISDTTWHHIAITHDGTTASFYIDGILDSQQGFSISFNSSNSYTIGSRGSGGEFFQGNIDDVRIWSLVRSQQEIQENMCAYLNGNENGLTCYYKFNETMGSILNDYSPNNNDGMLTNMDTILSWVISNAPCNGVNTEKLESGINQVVLYPNPFSNSSTLSISNEVSGFSLVIYDILGNKVRELAINNPLMQIEKESLPEGIYFLQVKNKNTLIATQKFVIQ